MLTQCGNSLQEEVYDPREVSPVHVIQYFLQKILCVGVS